MKNRLILTATLPMLATLTACGSSSEPQSGQTVAQLFSSEARAEGTVPPSPTEVAARGRGGPKGGGRDKWDTGRTAAPQEPRDAPDAAAVARPRGPKEKTKILVGRTAAPVGGEQAATPCQTPTASPEAAMRRGGPLSRDKEAVGRTATPPGIPDNAATERRRGPKERDGIDVGRAAPTSTDAAAAPVATPCPAPPDGAATGRRRGPLERDKEMTN